MPELKPCREAIANTIKPYLYIPMVREDDDNYINNRSLEIADKIISAWNTRKEGE